MYIENEEHEQYMDSEPQEPTVIHMALTAQ